MRKGEKASMVVFWKVMEQADKETGEQKTIPLLRYYSVFHIDQCEGLAARHSQPLPQTASTDQNSRNHHKWLCAALWREGGAQTS